MSEAFLLVRSFAVAVVCGWRRGCFCLGFFEEGCALLDPGGHWLAVFTREEEFYSDISVGWFDAVFEESVDDAWVYFSVASEGALVVFFAPICANEFWGHVGRKLCLWCVGCRWHYKTLLGGVIFDNGACLGFCDLDFRMFFVKTMNHQLFNFRRRAL